VNWADLMAAQSAFGTDFYDRCILRPKHRFGRPVIKIGPKGALGSHEIRPIHTAPSLGQSILVNICIEKCQRITRAYFRTHCIHYFMIFILLTLKRAAVNALSVSESVLRIKLLVDPFDLKLVARSELHQQPQTYKIQAILLFYSGPTTFPQLLANTCFFQPHFPHSGVISDGIRQHLCLLYVPKME